jgi:hypothetical protein
MAINRLQFGGLLNPKESFGWEEYGQPGPQITTPSLLGAGVFGDVAGKKLRTQRGLSCPTGTQPNASNTACVPIKKTGTCPTGTTGVWPNCTPIKVKGGTCPAGTTGVWPNCKPIKGNTCPDGTTGVWPNCKPIIGNTCPDGTTGVWPNCKPIGEDRGCIYGRDKYGNCIDPTGSPKSLFDERYKDKPYVTTADIGIVRQDPRTGQTITDTGISMADALKNYDLTPEESYRVTYSPYGAEERGQGAARGTWETPEDYNNRRILETFSPRAAFAPVQPWQETPVTAPAAAAPLSTEDFLAQYSRPPKTVDQGILGLEAERAAVEEINRANQRASEFSNIWDVPDSPSVDQFEEAREREEATERAEEFAPSPRKVPVDEFADIKKQESKRTKERVESAKKDLAKIRKKQADEKKKSDEKMKELAELSRKASLAAVQDISGASKAQKARRRRAVSKSKSKSKKAIYT